MEFVTLMQSNRSGQFGNFAESRGVFNDCGGGHYLLFALVNHHAPVSILGFTLAIGLILSVLLFLQRLSQMCHCS